VSGLQGGESKPPPRRPSARWWSASGGSRGGKGPQCDRRPTCACSNRFDCPTPPCQNAQPARAWIEDTVQANLPRYGGEGQGALPRALHHPFSQRPPPSTGLVEEAARDAALEPEPKGDPAGAALPGGGGFRRKLLRARSRPNDVPSWGGGRSSGMRPAPTTAASSE